MLNVIGKAINGIFDSPSDIFLRVKVLDLLFRGFIINCAKTEFAPKAVCTQLKKEVINGLVWEDNSQLRFSLFGSVSSNIFSKNEMSSEFFVELDFYLSFKLKNPSHFMMNI